MNTNRIALLVIAAASAVAAANGWAQDDAALDQYIAALAPGVCAAQPQLCKPLEAFADASLPCVPEEPHLTVGHAWLIDEAGPVTPIEYFVLRSQRAGAIALVQTQHVFSENDEERKAAEALIASIAGGVVDQGNALYRYLAESGKEIPQLLAQPGERSLVVRAEGPVIYLRQAGAQIFAVLPDTVVARPDSGERQAGTLFAVLPALAQCQ